ncbi:MAG: NYN domain-containing protein [Streptosporangiaceae bacterium]
MDRCALFVDAGYLLADGAMAVHGTRRRDAVSWDHAGLLHLLGRLAKERTGLPLLRCYWYESTPEGRRGPEHDALADIPGLKLRLGRVRPGRHDGVDLMVYRDLTSLARERAICDAVLVTGDEDMAQAVTDVQDLGTRVAVVHVAVDGNWTISRTLRQESDDLIEVGAAQLRPHVNLLHGADTSSPPLSNGQSTSHVPASVHGAGPSFSTRPSTAPAGGLTDEQTQEERRGRHHARSSYPTPPELESGPTGQSDAGTPESGDTSRTGSAGSGTVGPRDVRPPDADPGRGDRANSGHSYGSPYPGSNYQGPAYPGPLPPGPSGSPGLGSGYSPGGEPAPYSGVPPTSPPPSVPHQPAQGQGSTLADAVKSAHREGRDFGQSVARDAPALWLEAVLARKPRMPSDLEARLLQGSSLPIDFLLHDEVRHALRRGFWDALEASRR